MWSDHAPVTLSVNLTNPSPAPFIWKNTTYLLARPDTRQQITNSSEEFFSLNSSSVLEGFTLWNAHKEFIRGVLIQISSRWKKSQSKALDDIINSIKILEERLQCNPSSTNHKEILDARLQLRQLLMGEYESQLKKTKICHYNFMNKPGKLMSRRPDIKRRFRSFIPTPHAPKCPTPRQYLMLLAITIVTYII